MTSARLIDAVFILLGAVIGFMSSEVHQWLDTKRVRNAFLKAISVEIQMIHAQLTASRDAVERADDRFKRGDMPPQFNITFATLVFTAQFQHLRDASDPRVLAVANLYASLGSLQGIGALLNDHTVEYLRSDGTVRERSRDAIQSMLRVLREEIGKRLRLAEHTLETIGASVAVL